LGEGFLYGFLYFTPEYKMVKAWMHRLPALPREEGVRVKWRTLLAALSGDGVFREKEIVQTLLIAIPPGVRTVWWAEEADPETQQRVMDLLEAGPNGPVQVIAEGVVARAATLAKPTPPDKHKEEEGFYIDNAGLVLLHPFLKPLYTALQYWDADRFVAAE